MKHRLRLKDEVKIDGAQKPTNDQLNYETITKTFEIYIKIKTVFEC